MWFGCDLFLIVLGSVLDIRSGVFTCGYLFCVCYLCVGVLVYFAGGLFTLCVVVVLGIAWVCCGFWLLLC